MNADVAPLARLGSDAVAEILSELQRIGMITSHMHGTNRYNVLTPVGVLLAAEQN